METIKKGSKGEAVKTLQTKLNLVADGIFGSLTEEKVKELQREHNLVADGIVGAKTWVIVLAEPEKPVIVTNDMIDGVRLKRSKRTINMIGLHCSATNEGQDISVEKIKSWHTKPESQGGRGWSDIGYHYVITLDGKVNLGRDVDKSGAHIANYNSKSIGICYVGGLDKTTHKAKDTRTAEQKEKLLELVHHLMTIYNLPLSAVHCHYEFANKACPSFKKEAFYKEYEEKYGK